MKCEESKQLVPGYLDGELSEDQAAPLRQHLLECVACRSAMQSDKALKGWFVQSAAPEIPEGFAARVARRAMAGDKGESFAPLPSAGPALVTTDNDRRTYSFVLQATAIAATLLVALSIGIVNLRLPDGADLQADEGSLLISLDALDALNELEQAPLETEAPKDEK
jgi:anti-sigma factor RsiW